VRGTGGDQDGAVPHEAAGRGHLLHLTEPVANGKAETNNLVLGEGHAMRDRPAQSVQVRHDSGDCLVTLEKCAEHVPVPVMICPSSPKVEKSSGSSERTVTPESCSFLSRASQSFRILSGTRLDPVHHPGPSASSSESATTRDNTVSGRYACGVSGVFFAAHVQGN
jgi:hypothetical protein